MVGGVFLIFLFFVVIYLLRKVWNAKSDRYELSSADKSAQELNNSTKKLLNEDERQQQQREPKYLESFFCSLCFLSKSVPVSPPPSSHRNQQKQQLNGFAPNGNNV